MRVPSRLLKSCFDQVAAQFEEGGRLLVLLQDDPDPDGIASGLALRTLLGRNRTTAPLGSFEKISRAENAAMSRLLDIPVEVVGQQDLARISHKRSATAPSMPASPALRSENVLDVLSSTPKGIFLGRTAEESTGRNACATKNLLGLRAPCSHGPLRRLAATAREK